MALISCPECGKEVSDQAPNCPNCGIIIKTTEPVASEVQNYPKPKSKKIIPIVVIVAILVCTGIFVAFQSLNRSEIEFYSLFPEVPTVNNIIKDLESYSITKAGTVRYSHKALTETDLDNYRNYIARNGFTATQTRDNSDSIISLLIKQYYFDFESNKTGTKYYAALVDLRDGKGYEFELGKGTLGDSLGNSAPTEPTRSMPTTPQPTTQPK